jgi:branched-chain amino acid transport system substrate-binding protein
MTERINMLHEPTAASRRIVAACATFTLAALITGCAGSSPDTDAERDAIKIGAVVGETGGFPYAQVIPGVEAYLAEINGAGGVNGYTFEFTTADDKNDASEAAQAARKLVQQDGVVAMVGTTSNVDCDANGSFYESQSVGTVGLGVSPTCFSNPNWMPVNPGPFVGQVAQMTYAFETLGATNVCAAFNDDPAARDYVLALSDWFASTTGNEMTYVDVNIDPSASPVPAVTKAKNEGCEALLVSTPGPSVVAFMQAAESVGFDGTILAAASAMDPSVPEALGPLAESGARGDEDAGLIVVSEVAAVTSTEPDVMEAAKAIEASGATPSFWNFVGWLSAAVFVNAVENADPDDDPTTREGMLHILQSMPAFESGFTGVPLQFGEPNLSVQMMRVVDGEFQPASGQDESGWTIVPALPAA